MYDRSVKRSSYSNPARGSIALIGSTGRKRLPGKKYRLECGVIQRPARQKRLPPTGKQPQGSPGTAILSGEKRFTCYLVNWLDSLYSDAPV